MGCTAEIQKGCFKMFQIPELEVEHLPIIENERQNKTQDLTHKNGDSMDSHGDSIRGDTKNAKH